jgi:dipeptidyl aminopeptidase/acylaminoacyl peptidase
LEFSEVSLDKESIYWLETRSEQHGRRTIVSNRAGNGKNEDVTSAEFDVGTRVYEYGGGSYTVNDGDLFFSNFDDMKIYQQKKDSRPTPVTSNTPRFRYSEFAVDKRKNCIFCVREEHGQRHGTVVNTLVTISLETPAEGTVIASGNDFYLSPRLSPDGSSLAWVTWNFPNMPWDGTELWKAEVGVDGTLGEKVKIAGGPAESVIQPEWDPNGTLYFVSDRSGWWNIFRFRDGRVENMHAMKAEFGEAQWHLGMSTYAVGSRRLVCMYILDGIHHLATIDAESKKFENLPLPFTEISSVHASGEFAAFCASSPSTPTSIVKLELSTRNWTTLRRSTEAAIDPSYLSVPENVEYPTAHGLTAHAFYYPPKNRDYGPPRSERPPLLVKAHGGPTHAAAPSFDLQIQFFTSRGFAVLDVNYGGSTGYGRKYRERLNGKWGVIDVEDCANGAKFICSRDKADKKRLLIRGGSAGGFTTLASLAFTKTYKAGACYYGISDLEAWAKGTHKFESRYLDKMIGAYPARRDLYLKRSPIRFARKISAPLIIFQGLDDKVVPPTQSRIIAKQMRKAKIPVRCVEFEGEGHGFHVTEHIRKALELEIKLYSDALGIKLADVN